MTIEWHVCTSMHRFHAAHNCYMVWRAWFQDSVQSVSVRRVHVLSRLPDLRVDESRIQTHMNALRRGIQKARALSRVQIPTIVAIAHGFTYWATGAPSWLTVIEMTVNGHNCWQLVNIDYCAMVSVTTYAVYSGVVDGSWRIQFLFVETELTTIARLVFICPIQASS